MTHVDEVLSAIAEGTRLGDWMQTATGVQFWPLDPLPEDIVLEDIAHSLSNQCRFAGHCTKFYSVAQHSVIASMLVPPADQAWALLHDAAEAYLVDLPRPIKRHSKLGDEYREIESRLMAVVCERFGLSRDEPASVHEADNVMLMTEKRDFMPNSPAKWRETSDPLRVRLCAWTPKHAKVMFLKRAERLGLR